MIFKSCSGKIKLCHNKIKLVGVYKIFPLLHLNTSFFNIYIGSRRDMKHSAMSNKCTVTVTPHELHHTFSWMSSLNKHHELANLSKAQSWSHLPAVAELCPSTEAEHEFSAQSKPQPECRAVPVTTCWEDHGGLRSSVLLPQPASSVLYHPRPSILKGSILLMSPHPSVNGFDVMSSRHRHN